MHSYWKLSQSFPKCSAVVQSTVSSGNLAPNAGASDLARRRGISPLKIAYEISGIYEILRVVIGISGQIFQGFSDFERFSRDFQSFKGAIKISVNVSKTELLSGVKACCFWGGNFMPFCGGDSPS